VRKTIIATELLQTQNHWREGRREKKRGGKKKSRSKHPYSAPGEKSRRSTSDALANHGREKKKKGRNSEKKRKPIGGGGKHSKFTKWGTDFLFPHFLVQPRKRKGGSKSGGEGPTLLAGDKPLDMIISGINRIVTPGGGGKKTRVPAKQETKGGHGGDNCFTCSRLHIPVGKGGDNGQSKQITNSCRVGTGLL